MPRSLQITFLGLVFALLSSSCSDYQKVLKSSDPVLKLESAKEYFNKGDYFRALQLFDELVIIYRGRPEAEQINYYYAYCYYNEKQYILASYNFKNFVRTYPQSDLAEECMYMAAYCKYLLSPKHSLDQQNTMEAIRELQLFVDLFPESERIASCNDLIDQLRLKLEVKAFERSKLYYTTEKYQSAIYALGNFITTYPGSDYKEESLYLITRSSIIYAENSIPSKQKERYEAALEAVNKYTSHFPDGKWIKEVQGIEKSVLKYLAI